MFYVNAVFFTAFLSTLLNISEQVCNRVPKHATHFSQTDGGYQILIFDENMERVTMFQCGSTYRIKVRHRFGLRFIKQLFMIAVSEETSSNHEMESIGQFVLQTSESLRIVNTSNCSGMLKSNQGAKEFDFLWKAPISHPMSCVQLRITIVGQYSVYYKDSDQLTNTFCPYAKAMSMESDKENKTNDEMLKYSMNERPMIMECGACGYATYKMVFQGTWTRRTHPNQWPESDGLIHWTDIVGVSHMKEYGIYYPGGMAKSEVSQMCRVGDSSLLKSEFDEKARPQILSTIQTKAISAAQLEEIRTATFAVNRSHHLFSMLSMMGPSPDWCAGISDLDLCRADNTWKREVILYLVPWDAGVVTGNSYMSKPTTEMPQKPIMQIKPHYPPNNPFTVEKNRTRPVAKVTITRIDPTYDWQCKSHPKLPRRNMRRRKIPLRGIRRRGKSRRPSSQRRVSDAIQTKINMKCRFSAWSRWGNCSVECGEGVKERMRILTADDMPSICRQAALTEKSTCIGRKGYACPIDRTNKCAVSQWTGWSMCTAQCNRQGTQRRARSFQNYPSPTKRCKVRRTESRICHKPKSSCLPESICSQPRKRGMRCRPHTRYYYDVYKATCNKFRYNGCKGNDNRFASLAACNVTCAMHFAKLGRTKVTMLAALQKQHEMMLGERRNDGKDAMPTCELPKHMGFTCNRSSVVASNASGMWYFDKMMQECKPFNYSGCGGNANRHSTRGHCERSCRSYMLGTGATRSCRVTAWGRWSACSGDGARCGGRKRRERRIEVPGVYGGVDCPAVSQLQSCQPCCRFTQWNEWSKWENRCDTAIRRRSRNKIRDEDYAKCLNPEKMLVDTQWNPRKPNC